MHISLDHIAVLTESLERLVGQVPPACEQLEIEEYPSEGTREQYLKLGDDHAPRLLALQAISEGPYQRAFEKRGAGLHHLGCVTDSLEEAAIELGRKGLFLHTQSLLSQKHGTIWLCRPGIPFLVEVNESDAPHSVTRPVTIAIPNLQPCPVSLSALIPNVLVVASGDGKIGIGILDHKFAIEP